MKTVYGKALSEVYFILKEMPEDILKKIPVKFMNFVDDQRDKEYEVVIKKPLNINDFSKETIVLLGMIYKDFLVDEEEKKELNEEEKILLDKYKDEINSQYEIFNKNTQDGSQKEIQNEKQTENQENVVEENNLNKELIVINNESFFKKIIIKIKNLFKIINKKNNY